MNENLAIYPLLFPFAGAIVTLLWPKRAEGRRLVAVMLFAVQFLLSCFLVLVTYPNYILVSVIGGWEAPYGIALAIDLFAAIMLAGTNLVFLSTTIFGFGENPNPKSQLQNSSARKTALLSPITPALPRLPSRVGRRQCVGKAEAFPERSASKSSIFRCRGVLQPAPKALFFRLPLIFFLQTGVTLSFITGDFFNLFVAFEIMLVSSYALISLEADTGKKKYVYYYTILNIAASFLFLGNAAMIYGYTGSLNMAELSLRLENMREEPMILAIAMFALIVYGLKAGVFPFYFWLPDSYPSLPSSLTGLFSSILTKVGVYVLIRLFITVLPHHLPWVYETILILSGFTMFLGVLGAVSKSTVKGILCYHILSQVGYMVMALGFFTAAALSAGVFFILHNMIVKSSLILVGGIVASAFKTDNLEKISGFSSILPLAAIAFILQALSLAGVPPLSGFWGKYLLFSEGVRLGHYFLVTVGVLTSFLTLYSMIKIWTQAFWGPETAEYQIPIRGMKRLTAGVSLLVAASLVMGIGAQGMLQLTESASKQLFQREEYIKAVFAVKNSKERADL